MIRSISVCMIYMTIDKIYQYVNILIGNYMAYNQIPDKSDM